jgi:signal transduction histidine kinase
MPEASLSKRVTEQMLGGFLRALAIQPAKALAENFERIEMQTLSFAKEHVLLFEKLASVKVGTKAEFATAENGSLYQTNIRDGSSFFVPRSSVGKLDAEQREFAEKSIVLNPLYRSMVEDTPNVVAAYFNSDEPADMNRYYPFIEQPWEVYPADLDMGQFNFFYEADAHHNLQREVRWTGIYFDPAGKGWMLSCIAPVYVGDILKGVVGLDLTVDEMVDSIVKLSLPAGASSLLLTKSGRIIAATDRARDLLGIEGRTKRAGPVQTEDTDPDFSQISRISDMALRKHVFEFLASDESQREIPSAKGALLVVQSEVKATGWRFWLVVRRDELLGEVDELALAESKLQKELQAKEAELAYSSGKYNAARGLLHDLRNAVTRLEAPLMTLNRMSKAFEGRYPQAFELIRAGGPDAPLYLQSLEEMLTKNVVAELKRTISSIDDFKRLVRTAASYMERDLKGAVREAPENIDIPELLGDLVADIRRAHPALVFVTDLQPGASVKGNKPIIKAGLDNIIRNAIEASSVGGTIRISGERVDDGTLVTVTDGGHGIAAEDLSLVTTMGFTKNKENGTGLGLHFFALSLEASGGELTVESQGPGKGATVKALIKNA